MSFTAVTLSGTFKTPEDDPSRGTITFQLTELMKDTAGNQIATRVPVRLTLDANGAFTTTLYANDDVGVTPTGVTYEVTEEIDGIYRNYFISLPKANPTVNLADL